ncbi:hypothetical protein [uncultured Tateyamaria sp.]|uniref:hypothetical protein n=1 Tax=uncultured Tateyamaria sp. TaxID=455651 RepID=UPI002626A654|nr:hypothetical protein [uncultured Tateyamaria sp.]
MIFQGGFERFPPIGVGEMYALSICIQDDPAWDVILGCASIIDKIEPPWVNAVEAGDFIL